MSLVFCSSAVLVIQTRSDFFFFFNHSQKEILCESAYALRSLLASDDNRSSARPKENEKNILSQSWCFERGCAAFIMDGDPSEPFFSSLLLCWSDFVLLRNPAEMWGKRDSDAEGGNELNPLTCEEWLRWETKSSFPPCLNQVMSLQRLWFYLDQEAW